MCKALDFSFCLLFLLWILPSGQILGFPIKMLVFAICLFCFILASISSRKTIRINNRIISLFFILVAICFWMFIAVIHGYTKGLMPMLRVVMSFAGMLMLADLYFINFGKACSIKRLARLFYISVILFVGFKIVLEVLFFLKVISYETIIFIFEDIFSSQVITFYLPFGSSAICRIGTPNDAIPLILLGFDLIFRKRSYLARLIILIVSFAFSLITYSRLIFLQFVTVLFCFIFYSFRQYGHRKSTVLRITVTFAFSLILIVIFLGLDTSLNSSIQTYISSRFSSDAVSASDDIRQTQFRYLFNGFKEHPVLGNGFGSYVKEYIRSEETIFSYELEYLSFLYQFGLVGFFVIVVGFVAIAYSFMVNSINVKEHKMFFYLNFFMWAFKPLFNPYMLSSLSAMAIIGTHLLALYYSPLLSMNSGKIIKHRMQLTSVPSGSAQHNTGGLLHIKPD